MGTIKVSVSVLIAGMLWVLPFAYPALAGPYSAHDVARLCQLLLLAVLAVLYAAAPERAAPLRVGRRIQGLTVLLVALTAGSVAMSAHPLVALREVLLLCGMWLVAHVVADDMRRHSVVLPLRALCAGTVLYGSGVLMLLGLYLSTGYPLQAWETLFGFDNPRFLNHVLTVTVPLVAVLAARQDTSSTWRWMARTAGVMNGALMFITYGRATPLALAVALMVAVWACRGGIRRYAFEMTLPVIVGLAGLWLLWHTALSDGGFFIDTAELVKIHMRDFLALQALSVLRESPWLGVGPMHFSHHLNIEAAHPHNLYLQWLTEIGPLATALALLLVAVYLARLLQPLRAVGSDQQALAAGLWTAVAAVLVDAALSGNFVMPVSQLWIAMMWGWLLAAHRLANGTSSPSDTITIPAGMRALRVVLAASLLWLAAQGASEFLASGKPALPTPQGSQAPMDQRLMNPRFWSHGWF